MIRLLCLCTFVCMVTSLSATPIDLAKRDDVWNPIFCPTADYDHPKVRDKYQALRVGDLIHLSLDKTKGFNNDRQYGGNSNWHAKPIMQVYAGMDPPTGKGHHDGVIAIHTFSESLEKRHFMFQIKTRRPGKYADQWFYAPELNWSCEIHWPANMFYVHPEINAYEIAAI